MAKEPISQEPRLFSIERTARYLDCTPAGLRMRIARGKFPEQCIVRLGGRIMIDRPSLEEYIEQQRGHYPK